MATECSVEQNLCPIFDGDTIPFAVKFEDTEGLPIDISGMKLYFTMKDDPADDDNEPGDLQDSVTFPSDANSALGLGELIIPATKAATLKPGTTYTFDFQLVNGDVIATMGKGTIKVNQGVTKAVT